MGIFIERNALDRAQTQLDGAQPAWTGSPLVAGKSRILVIGDSLADGLSRPLRRLAEANDMAFQTIAISGTRIDQWANPTSKYGHSLEDALSSSPRPTHVFVSLGTNDQDLLNDAGPARLEQTLGAMRARLRGLLSRLDAAGVEVIWVGAPKLPNPNDEALQMIRREVPAARDFRSDNLDNRELHRAKDGVHCTDYGPWANDIWSWLGAPRRA